LFVVGCQSPCHTNSGVSFIVEKASLLSSEERRTIEQLGSVTVGDVPAGLTLDFVHCLALLNARAATAGLPVRCMTRVDSAPKALVGLPLTMTLDTMLDNAAQRSLLSGVLEDLGLTDQAALRREIARLNLYQWLYFVAKCYNSACDINRDGAVYLFPDGDIGQQLLPPVPVKPSK
jgi:hypothetical protein